MDLIAIDGGNFKCSWHSESKKITAAETWNVLSNLTSSLVVRVEINATDLTEGEVAVSIDGIERLVVLKGKTGSIVYESSSSLSIITRKETTAYNIDYIDFDTSTNLAVLEAVNGGIRCNNTGSKIYYGGSNSIYEIPLSTNYDLSTAGTVSSLNVSSYCDNIRNLQFLDSGNKLFIFSQNDCKIVRYNLSTAYGLSTATYHSSVDLDNTFGFGSFGNGFFSDLGTELFCTDTDRVAIRKSTLSTAYDLNTITKPKIFLGMYEYIRNIGSLSKYNDMFYSIDIVDDFLYQYTPNLSVIKHREFPNATDDGFTFEDNGNRFFMISGLEQIHQYSMNAAPNYSGTVYAHVSA